MFKANTNASLKNLETQVRQIALTMQNQSKDVFPSDTMKNPKYCMAVTLRSGRKLEERRNENMKTTEENHTKIGDEIQQYSSKVNENERTVKV